ncbi:hypothetical protein SAMN04488123_1326 [Natribacillus halophilus]|uniref:Uncharacterized protein n=1 Tax=Natribacillus halophilus TaxID=549003 RepID=A0A1G8SPU8_9BACI|nr:hypothetical protein SAMN04488123_1326 [Natribacillus halophilus]
MHQTKELGVNVCCHFLEVLGDPENREMVTSMIKWPKIFGPLSDRLT